MTTKTYFDRKFKLNEHGFFGNTEKAQAEFPLNTEIKIDRTTYYVKSYRSTTHTHEGKTYSVVAPVVGFYRREQGEGVSRWNEWSLRSLYMKVQDERRRGNELEIKIWKPQ